jgi:N-acetylmuramoyl-L-alanine amidase
MKIVISSGHGLFVRGANGIIDEVDEARCVVDEVASNLKKLGVDVTTYHDDVSKTQDENLRRIVDFHNSQAAHDLDISVHFNAFEQVSKPMGTEVWYLTAQTRAASLSNAIASVGFIDRGAKKSDDLYFLNETAEASVLLEICFVDSEADCVIYSQQFDAICKRIAQDIYGPSLYASGKVSWFGGPLDAGVDPDEGLAFISSVDQAPHLFLPKQPADTTGLARRLDPGAHYIACRWDYGEHSKTDLLAMKALVRAKKTGIALIASPADWGPHADTGRVADLSSGLMTDLGIETDDEVDVIFPYEG